MVHSLTPAPEEYENEDFGVSADSGDFKERRFASSQSGICSWGISSNGRAPASHAGSTGIDTRILQNQDFSYNSHNVELFSFPFCSSLFLIYPLIKRG